MSSDLEASLIDGGITPAAAKTISNAIANAASAQLALGRRFGDETPRQQMRLIDSDTRRYLLPNLDYDTSAAKQPADQWSPRSKAHPYSDSQPATAQPTLTTGSVKPGKYVEVSSNTENSVAQSQVSLKVRDLGGRHARLNPATGTIESVPFLVEIDQEQGIEARIEERANATVLRLRLRTS